MARLRNTQSGAVVSVSDEKAARLGAEWESLDEQKKAPAKRTTKAAAKSTKSDDES